MASKSKHFCAHYGCSNLVTTTYCEEHAEPHQPKDNRASAGDRGYDYQWSKFSKWYLSQPENQFCALHISPNCKEVAECVDHIVALTGPNDPRKYDRENLQPSCLACNTLKGKQTIKGEWEYGKKERQQAVG